MKRLFCCFTLACCFAIAGRTQNNIDSLSTDGNREWKDLTTYEEREHWVMSIMNQHYALLAKEPFNFDNSRPFLVNRIRECDTYYAIEVIDSTRIFHYTVVSPKTKKSRHKNKNDIVVGHVYYFTLRKLTNYSGKIGCSEVLHDVTFDVNGVEVRYISSDVLDAPPCLYRELKRATVCKTKETTHSLEVFSYARHPHI